MLRTDGEVHQEVRGRRRGDGGAGRGRRRREDAVALRRGGERAGAEAAEECVGGSGHEAR